MKRTFRILFRLSVRTLLVALAAFLLLAGLTVWWVSSHAEMLLVQATKRLGYDLILKDFQMTSSSSIRFQGATIGRDGKEFLWFQILDVSWDWPALLRGEIREVRVYGLYLWLKEMQAATAQSSGEPSSSSGFSGSFPLLIKTLIINNGVLNLNNLSSRYVNLAVPIGQVAPLLYRNVRLGAGQEDPAMQEIQTISLDSVTIHSPVDPLVPVLGFRKITLKFSLAGLAARRLDSIFVDTPRVYIGEDLFWFVDQVKSEKADPNVAGEPWEISNYQVKGGRLIIMYEGKTSVVLPLTFETEGSGLVLGGPTPLQLKTRVVIPETNLDYPDYNVRIHKMEGELYFGIPPGEKGNENIVPSVKIQKLTWKDIEATKVDFGMTFDRTGIYGKFSGQAYKGQVEGGFACYLEDGFPWIGWGSTTDVNVAPVTKLLSPENFVMNGPVNCRFIVKGRTKVIVGLGGSLDLKKPGTMEITAVDDLLKKLPAEWASFKRDLANIGLQAFRRYDYSSGHAEFTFAPPSSFLKLDLDGKQGKRNFDIHFLQNEADGLPVETVKWR